MKVKCIIACTGIGYKDFEVGEERNLKKELAEKLISFGYVQIIEKPKKEVSAVDDTKEKPPKNAKPSVSKKIEPKDNKDGKKEEK